MQHGSLQNVIIAGTRGATSPQLPAVGDPCTVVYWSDRHAYEVVEVRATKRPSVYIRPYVAHIVSGSGHDGSAVYRFEPNPTAPWTRVTFRKGSRKVACWQTVGGAPVTFGKADEYLDPSF